MYVVHILLWVVGIQSWLLLSRLTVYNKGEIVKGIRDCDCEYRHQKQAATVAKHCEDEHVKSLIPK